MSSPREWDASTYDRVSAPQETWGRDVLERLDLQGDERVLDAGCGTGRVTALLAERLPRGRVLAVDGSEAMVAETRRRLGGRVEAFASDLLDLELAEPVDYRMALDHPQRISAVAVLDVVPTGEVWSQADAQLALLYWHWGFLAQPAPLPERMISADPGAFFDLHVRRLGLGQAAGRYPPEVMAAYRRQLDDPQVIEAICEDYRAGAGIDREHDDADRRQGRRIGCALLLLWSSRGALSRLYGDVLDVWRPWADDVRGHGVDASHFLAEDEPDVVADHLTELLDSAAWTAVP